MEEVIVQRDSMMEAVRDFHQAFGCHIADQPGFPDDLTLQDKHLIMSFAYELRDLGRRLKGSAHIANDAGRTSLGLLLIRLQLLTEELGELASAIGQTDLVEALDALADIGYVLNGTYLTLGLADHKSIADTIVHVSNMSKLDEGGKPIIDGSGRVVKGPGYKEPKAALKAILGLNGRTS